MNKKTTAQILMFLNLEHGRTVTEEMINLWAGEFGHVDDKQAMLAAKWILYHPQPYGPAKVNDFARALLHVTKAPAIAPTAGEAWNLILDGVKNNTFKKLPKLVAKTAENFGDIWFFKTDTSPGYTRTQFVKEYKANRETYLSTAAMPIELKNKIKTSRLNAKEKLTLQAVQKEAARISQRPTTAK